MIALLIIVLIIYLAQDILFNRLLPRELVYSCAFTCGEAAEGDVVHLTEVIENHKPIPVLWLMVDIHTSRFLDYGGAWSALTQKGRRVTSLFSLRGRQKITRRWDVVCRKRGVYSIDFVTFVWGGLLGNKTGSKAVNCNTSLVVYPAQVDLDNLFAPRNLTQGNLSVRRFLIDDPFVFSGVREYTQNDPMNRIHWGASARTGALMVRQNDYTSEISVMVALNIQSAEDELSDSFNEDESEFAIRVAASAAGRAVAGGAMCAFCSNAVTTDDDAAVSTAFGSGAAQMQNINEILARLECKNRVNFTQYLEDLAKKCHDCDLVVVTAYLNRDMAAHCERLRAQNNSVTVLLLDGRADTSGGAHGFTLFSIEREEGGDAQNPSASA